MRFNDLRSLNDTNSFVWMALNYNPAELRDIEAWLKDEVGFLPPEAELERMELIEGNVKGTRGRSDVVFVTKAPTHFHPLKRLFVDGLKWTSDFIDNHAIDYGTEVGGVASADEDDEE